MYAYKLCSPMHSNLHCQLQSIQQKVCYVANKKFQLEPNGQMSILLRNLRKGSVNQKKIYGGFGFIYAKYSICLYLQRLKVAWKVATNRCSLCVKLLITKFKVRDNWLKGDKSKNPYQFGEEQRQLDPYNTGMKWGYEIVLGESYNNTSELNQYQIVVQRQQKRVQFFGLFNEQWINNYIRV